MRQQGDNTPGGGRWALNRIGQLRTQFFTWAFSLQSRDVPVDLSLQPVLPVADALQGGWAGAVWDAATNFDMAGGTVWRPEGATDPLFGDVTLQRLIIGFSVEETTGLGAVGPTVILEIRPVQAASFTHAVYRGVVPLSTLVGNNTTLPGGPQIVPPGAIISVALDPGDNAGQRCDVSLLWARMPAGCKTR